MLFFYITLFSQLLQKSNPVVFLSRESEFEWTFREQVHRYLFFLVNIIGDFYLFIYLFLPRVCNPEEYKLWILSLHLFLFFTIFTHYYIYYLNYS